MPKHHKNTNLSAIYILFLIGFTPLNPDLTNAFSISEGNQKISQAQKSRVNLLAINPSVDQKASTVIHSNVNESTDLIAEFSLDIFTSKNPEDNQEKQESIIALELIRKVSFFFFLLFFLPLGIFYPLFLLYRMLLTTDEEINPFEDEEVFETSLALSTPSEVLELESYSDQTTSDQTTIVKLQISFLPKVVNFKQQLKQATINVDRQKEYKEIDLMRSALSIFITQQYWTHANYESSNFSSVEAQEKFKMILEKEQNKCFNRQPSMVTSDKQHQVFDHNYEDNFKYTVVTMLFRTINSDTSFEQINTKDSLAKLLIDLSQLDEDSLLDFELIWNPVQENEYITNEQLLTHYGDMIRLLY